MLHSEELFNKLWGAADILRGSIDSGDYKDYIFAYFFLKRCSDVFFEEAQKILAETNDPDQAYNDPDEHTLFIPEHSRWTHLETISANYGNALNVAFAQLEEHDSNTEKLAGIFKGLDFMDERKLGDLNQSDTIHRKLIEHFSKLNLRNDNLAEPDLMGRAYEYLIEKFADDAGKKGGEFYTPKTVVELLVCLLDPQPAMRICDPTCGSGGMLIQSAKYVHKLEPRPRRGAPLNLSLYGQEKNGSTWAICKMNLLLHDLPDATIIRGDTIAAPGLLQDGALRLFDRVIANPPFSLDQWGIEHAESDGFRRFTHGVPPKSKGDFAFVQHMIATTNQTGRAGVIVPHGVLFRGGAEAKIRQSILEQDLFEAIISLPSNLFYGTGIPAAILIFNRAKKLERQNKVLFIDASAYYQESKKQNTLRTEDIERINHAYTVFTDQDKFAKVVTLQDIKQNDFNLNISRYVATAEPEAEIDLVAEIKKLRQLEQQRATAEAEVNKHLRDLGFEL